MWSMPWKHNLPNGHPQTKPLDDYAQFNMSLCIKKEVLFQYLATEIFPQLGVTTVEKGFALERIQM
jgi:hypothetical protein